ncbi:MAG: hypothetical protein QOH25_3662 [Acidobacteriota bacterium]|jgi:hypothetical protein|nr:hypothetical protein [Acidobacteriota bacterium]
MRECIEEGIIQAYVDDELSLEMTDAVAMHISACANCARAAGAAAGETAQFASAFEAENALEIPTVRLRERLDAAIAEMNRPAFIREPKRGASLGGWLATFAGLFKVSPQRAFGYASLVAVVAFAAIFAIVRWNRPATNDSSPSLVASSENPKATGGKVSPSPTPAEAGGQQSPDAPPDKDDKGTPSKRRAPKKQPKPTLVPAPSELQQDELAKLKPLPGEQNYLKAIDTLTVEIKAGGDTALKPSLRAEYERNLAIVDQAIAATRRTARRNPSNPDASEFLYSSYQSKLDLLSAVAEQVRPTIATR